MSFGPGVQHNQKEEIQQLLGVEIVPFHKRYLGLPTMTGRNKKEMYKRLNDQLDSHLFGWQSKFLSKAGNMTLIAQAVPTYTMSVFRLPKGVHKSFQANFTRFWWGKGAGKKCIHWCKWENLCRGKREGGLGFRDLELFN